MTRQQRTYSLVENGLYHIIARGNNRKAIFKEEEDYKRWKEYLAFYKTNYNSKVLAYVLMPNHYHLLLKAGTYLPKLIGVFNSRYAMHFNRKYKEVGHLFQGRYKSYLVGTDPYLITLIRYIHNNPVRANLVENSLDYGFSSLNDYNKVNSLVDKKIIERFIDGGSKGTPLEYLLS